MIIIADTTPIISLLKINQLHLLEDLFGTVIIPEAVYNELCYNSNYLNEREQIIHSKAIVKSKVEHTEALNILRKSSGLDAGETEAIYLAFNKKADLLLMDEKKGRTVAKEMDLHVMGTMGILLSAFNKNCISKDEIIACIDILKNEHRHISNKLYDQLLEQINNK